MSDTGILFKKSLLNQLEKSLKNNQWNDAENYASSVLEFEPSLSNALIGRAIARRHLGNYIGCEKDLLLVLKKDPNNISALNNIGVLYATSGNKEKAVESWEKILQISPENTAAKENLERLQ